MEKNKMEKDLIIDVPNNKEELQGGYKVWSMVSMWLTFAWFVSLFFQKYQITMVLMMLVYQSGMTAQYLKVKLEQ